MCAEPAEPAGPAGPAETAGPAKTGAPDGAGATAAGGRLPDLELVVARYREDLSWLAETALPARVYNKGPAIDRAIGQAIDHAIDQASGQAIDRAIDRALLAGGVPAGVTEGVPEIVTGNVPENVTVEPLPNIGREAHTFLTHIVARYDALPQWTAFLQGDPFAHLSQPGAPRLTPQALRQRLLELIATGKPFSGLAWFRLRCDGLGRPHDLADPAKQGRWLGWGKDIPVAATFEALFGPPAPEEFIARAPTGNMLVRRERILARPLGFYRRALDLILADPQDAENTGHAFERLWQAIFSGAAGSVPRRS